MPLPQPQPHDPALSADIRAISDAIEVLQGQVAAITTMVGSGASHAGGLVPDTPVSSGITKFLREDGTWAVPGGAPDPEVGTPPVPVLVVVNGTSGYAPHSIVAQGFQTTPGDSAITSHAFDWGDGSAVTQTMRNISGTSIPVQIAYHEYTVVGTYTLRYTVTDANANTVSTTQTITVSARPAATITVNPGADITAILNAAPASAVVQINAGTYSASGYWNTKNNQIVYANGAVTITGGGTQGYFMSFSNSSATGVIVQGIRLTAFTVWAIYFNAAGRCTFKNVEVDTCGANGTTTGAVGGFSGTSVVLANCHIHHNNAYGVAGGGATLTIIGGEYNHNFTDTSGSVNPNVGDGVWKQVHGNGDYVVGGNFHDNQGNALWWDGSNLNTYVCLNTITNNYGNGIFCEINIGTSGDLDGSGFSIRWLYNTLSGNGYPATSWFPTGNIYPSNLWVSKSNKIEMAYNIVDGGAHGICLDYQVGRAEGANLANISIHHNDIRLRETTPGGGAGVGRVGFHNSIAGTAYSLTNVTFANNHYYANNDSNAAGWTHFLVYVGTTEIGCDFGQWKSYGYDTTGSTMALAAAWPH